jgi:myxalamid-type polyketide synthase MxaB
LRERARFFRKVARENGLTIGGDEESPVASLIVGDDKMAMMLSHNLLEHGIEVQPIVRPAVSATTARLRFFLTANHTEEQIQATVPVIARELEKLRRSVG